MVAIFPFCFHFIFTKAAYFLYFYIKFSITIFIYLSKNIDILIFLKSHSMKTFLFLEKIVDFYMKTVYT